MRLGDSWQLIALVILQAVTAPAPRTPAHPRRTCSVALPCVSRLRGGCGAAGGQSGPHARKRVWDDAHEASRGTPGKCMRAGRHDGGQAGVQEPPCVPTSAADVHGGEGEAPEDPTIAPIRAAFSATATPGTLGELSVRAVELCLSRAPCSGLRGPTKSIQGLMSCPKCWALITDATTLPCGHTFCAACAAKGACPLSACMYAIPLKGRAGVDAVLCSAAKRCFPREVELRESGLQQAGNARMRERDFEGAARAYAQALELNPRNHLVLGNMALALLGRGDSAEDGEERSIAYASAVAMAERAVRFVPEWAKGWYRLAQAHGAGGNATAQWASFSICAHLLSQNGTPSPEEASLRGQGTKRPSRRAGDAALRVLAAACNVSEGGAAAFMPGAAWGALEEAAQALCATRGGDADLECLVMAQDFGCELCGRIPDVPVTAVCGHTFCETCLQRCLEQTSSCPSCCANLYMYTTRANTTANLTAGSHSSAVDAHGQPKTSHFGANAVICALLCRRFADRKRDAAQIEKDRMMAAPFTPLGPHPGSRGEWIGVFVCTIAFPGVPCPVNMAEPRYKLMVRRAMVSGGVFGICLPREEGGGGDFVDCGTLLRIKGTEACEDGRLHVDADAVETFRILDRGTRDGYDVARIERICRLPSTSSTNTSASADNSAHTSNDTATRVNQSISGMEELIAMAKEWEQGRMWDEITEDIGPLPAYSDMNALSWWYAAFCTLLMGTGTAKDFDDLVLSLLLEGDPIARLHMADRARRMLLSAWSGTVVHGKHSDALPDILNRASELRQRLADESESESGAESGDREQTGHVAGVPIESGAGNWSSRHPLPAF